MMPIRCIWEHNGSDTLLYAADFPGAFTRGESLEAAAGKMGQEVASYRRWKGEPGLACGEVTVVQDKPCELNVQDADSDVLFAGEEKPLTLEEYQQLKDLALKSAADFQALYDAVTDKDVSYLTARKTFYGPVPRTAREIYRHTKSVNAYYFGEIDVDADNEGTILECRARGFEALETMPDFLTRRPVEGSYGEMWSLRKVLRRFLWHDRIHAKAMYRMALRTFGPDAVPNIFCF